MFQNKRIIFVVVSILWLLLLLISSSLAWSLLFGVLISLAVLFAFPEESVLYIRRGKILWAAHLHKVSRAWKPEEHSTKQEVSKEQGNSKSEDAPNEQRALQGSKRKNNSRRKRKSRRDQSN
jgi:hypothetical protein